MVERMPPQAIAFLAAIIGIPIVVAWIFGGEKAANRSKGKKKK